MKTHKKTGVIYGYTDGIYYKVDGTICHFDDYTIKHRLRDSTEDEESEFNEIFHYSGIPISKSSVEIKLHEVKPEVGKYYRFRFRHYDTVTESLIYVTKVKYDELKKLWYIFGINGKMILNNRIDDSIREFNHLPIQKYFETYHEGTTLDEVSEDEFFEGIDEVKFKEILENANDFILK